MKEKTLDAVAFMRKRREELSRTYAGLTTEQIRERIQQSLKNDPLWKGSQGKGKTGEKGPDPLGSFRGHGGHRERTAEDGRQ